MSQNVAGPLSFTNVKEAPWYKRGGFASQTAYVAIAFLLITALVSVFAHNFLSYGNLLNTSKNFSYIAIVALGSTLVIITGGIDLSVGSVMALVAVLTAMLMKGLSRTAVAHIPYAVMIFVCRWRTGRRRHRRAGQRPADLKDPALPLRDHARHAVDLPRRHLRHHAGPRTGADRPAGRHILFADGR